MQYCLPYKGSKRKLAARLIAEMQKRKTGAKYFYDLFGGGGAMSFAALEAGFTVFYNDADAGLSGFMRYLVDRIQSGKRGKFGLFPDSWYEFVTRGEFFNQKDKTTPYAEFCRLVYSFGNNRRDYLYGRDIEEIKKELHNKIVYKMTGGTLYERMREYKKSARGKERVFRDISHIEGTQNIERLQNIGRTQTIERLQNIESLQNMRISGLSYDVLSIPHTDAECIVYCDPPYRGTNKYNIPFDHDAFFSWVKNHEKEIFVSEYDAPFTEIFSAPHRSTLSKTNKSKITVEKLYTNRGV